MSNPILPPGLDEERLGRFLREEGRKWLHDSNIVSIELGEKKSGDAGTGVVAIKFEVMVKLSDRAEIIRAGSRPIPDYIEIDGVSLPTDVEEGWPETQASAAVNPKARHDPVCGGISVGTRTDTGTLGAILRHKPTGQAVALSNWHILANDQQSDSAFQPGPADSGGPADVLGVLKDRALDLDLDAAICTIGNRGVSSEIAGLGVAVSAAKAPEVGMRVAKAGKESDVTFGRIINAQKIVSYRVFGRAQRHQIMVCVIEPDPKRPNPSALSKQGDSGSCWMLLGNDGRPTGTIIGLHVAGDAGRKLAYACHADKLFERFALAPVGDSFDDAHAAIPAANGLAVMHRVLARDGLLVRSGPGTEFPERGDLPFGTVVSVLSRHGEWFMVDLQGDSQADGFMHGSFLQPLAQS